MSLTVLLSVFLFPLYVMPRPCYATDVDSGVEEELVKAVTDKYGIVGFGLELRTLRSKAKLLAEQLHDLSASNGTLVSECGLRLMDCCFCPAGCWYTLMLEVRCRNPCCAQAC